MVWPAGTPRLRGVHGTDDSNIWAVGDDATILHFNGVVWHTVYLTPGLGPTLYAVYSDIAGTTTTAWAAGSDGTIIKLEGG